MPLEKQTVEINAAGLAEGLDARVLPQGQGWLVAENVVMTSGGAFEKRAGYAVLPSAAYESTGEALPTAFLHDVKTLRDALHAYGTDTDGAPSWWAYSDDVSRWGKRGGSVACSFLLTPKIGMGVGVSGPAVVQTDNGCRTYAWRVTDSTPVAGLTYQVIRVEDSTGAELIGDRTVIQGSAGTADAQGLTACGNSSVVVFKDGFPGTVYTRAIDTATGTVGASTAIIFNAALMAVCRYNSGLYVIAWTEVTGAGTDLHVERRAPDGTLDSSYVTSFPADAIGSLQVGALSGVGVCVCLASAILGIVEIRLSAALTLVGTSVVDPTLTLPQFLGASIDANGASTVSWQVISGSTFEAWSARTSSAGVLEWTARTQNMRWASNVFEVQGRPYAFAQVRGISEFLWTTVLVALKAPRPPISLTGFTNELHAVITQYASDASAVAFLAGQPPAQVDFDPVTSRGLFVVDMAELGAPNAASSGSLCELDFSVRQPWNRQVSQQRNCYALSGGIAGWNDGATEVEIGFVSPPQIELTNTGPGPIGAGTYVYTAVYEWQDERGNVHVSQPADPQTITVGAGSTIRVRTVTLGVTRKGQHTRTNFEGATIAIFRTENNGQIFYRETPPRNVVGNTIFNDGVTVGFVDYIDINTDAVLTGLGYGTLYCSFSPGGVVPARAVPGMRHTVVHRQRLFGIDASDPRRILFSQIFVPGEGPRFNEKLTLRLDDSEAECTALASMDDKLIVFTKTAIFWVSGDGPNDTALGGAFNGPFPVSVDAGCIDPRSVVLTPQGVYFQGPRGIMLLDRGLAVAFAGLAVQRMTDGRTIQAATLDADARRVHFLVEHPTLPNTFAVLDYTFGVWTTTQLYAPGRFGGVEKQDADGSVMWRGAHVTIGGTSQAVMSQTALLDAGVYPPSIVETPWIKLSGINGYQRAWRVTATGQKMSDHAITFGVFADYSETQQQQAAFDVGAASTVLGLPVERLSLVVKPQRCSAIKVRISDSEPAGALGPSTALGWSLAAVSFEIGVQRGTARLPARNKG